MNIYSDGEDVNGFSRMCRPLELVFHASSLCIRFVFILLSPNALQICLNCGSYRDAHNRRASLSLSCIKATAKICFSSAQPNRKKKLLQVRRAPFIHLFISHTFGVRCDCVYNFHANRFVISFTLSSIYRQLADFVSTKTE